MRRVLAVFGGTVVVLCVLCRGVNAAADPYTLALDSVKVPDSVAVALLELYQEARYYSCAELPGAVVPHRDPSECYHPVDLYVSAWSSDTQPELTNQLKGALMAYFTFNEVPPRKKERVAIAHDRYLELLEMEPVTYEPNLFKRWLDTFLYWIGDLIVGVLRKLLGPLARAPNLVKIIALVAGVVLLFALAALTAYAFQRLPALQNALDRPALAPASRRRSAGEWLRESRRLLAAGNPRAALGALYAWLTTWLEQRGAVRRFEWWTNRQLLRAVGNKAPAVHPLAGEIVATYERVEYGHEPVAEESVGHLVDSASRRAREGNRKR